MIAPALGWLAVASLAVASVPLAESDASRTITAANCGGGTITITLEQEPGDEPPDCPKGACHAGLCRQPQVTKEPGDNAN